jgi:hypothetical protein
MYIEDFKVTKYNENVKVMVTVDAASAIMSALDGLVNFSDYNYDLCTIKSMYRGVRFYFSFDNALAGMENGLNDLTHDVIEVVGNVHESAISENLRKYFYQKAIKKIQPVDFVYKVDVADYCMSTGLLSFLNVEYLRDKLDGRYFCTYDTLDKFQNKIWENIQAVIISREPDISQVELERLEECCYKSCFTIEEVEV